MKNSKLIIIVTIFTIFVQSCVNKTVTSSGGVAKASTNVPVNQNGRTIEQENIIARLQMDNKPGSIKHLYVISSYSGQVLIYSTVKGKVTSSGKRISPVSVVYTSNSNVYSYNPDLIQDDGTYGTSSEYIYWWDTKNVYHQLYPQGGQIITLSDQPLAVKNVIMNFELNQN